MQQMCSLRQVPRESRQWAMVLNYLLLAALPAI
jgi:hypothetical protein